MYTAEEDMKLLTKGESEESEELGLAAIVLHNGDNVCFEFDNDMLA